MLNFTQRLCVFFTLFFLTAPIVGFGEGASTPNIGKDNDVLAIVGDVSITREQFKAEIRELDPIPNARPRDIDARRFLKELVEKVLLEQEALKQPNLNTPEFIEQKNKIVQSHLSRAVLQDMMEKAAKDTKVKGDYMMPPVEFSYHVHQMTLPTLEEAKKVKSELAGGKSFQELAKVYSKDAFNERGGDRGFMRLVELHPAVADALSKLATNTVSDPIETAPDSFILIKYSEKVLSPEFEAALSEPAIGFGNPEIHHAAFEKAMKDMCDSMGTKLDESVYAIVNKENISPEEKEKVFLTIGTETIKVSALIEDINQIPEFIRPQILAGDGLKDFVKQFVYRETIRCYAQKHFDELAKKFPEVIKQAEKDAAVHSFLTNKMKDVTVTDDELKSYYSKNLTQLARPETRKAHHILVDSEEKAKSILDRIQKGESFEEIAKKESKCPSGKQGGDLGVFVAGQMVPEFEAALNKAEVGKVFGPVKTQFGYHIVRLDERKPAGAPPFEEVKEKLRAELLPEKQREKFQTIIQELRQKYKVQEFPEKL